MIYFCRCGCGEEIKICSHHKWYGIPKFIHGHNTILNPPMKNYKTAKKNSDIRRGKPIEKMKGENNPSKRLFVREKIRKSKLGNKNPMFGKHHTDEHNKKIGESNKGKTKDEKNGMFGKKAWNSGLTKETDSRVKNISEKKKGENHPSWNPNRNQVYAPYNGDFFTNAPKVRKWSNYICQLCFKPGKTVHHIDENKRNGKLENLVNLCKGCNTKLAHKNKGIWTIFYQPYFYSITKRMLEEISHIPILF